MGQFLQLQPIKVKSGSPPIDFMTLQHATIHLILLTKYLLHMRAYELTGIGTQN